MNTPYISDRRFRLANVTEAIEWLKTHRYVWYHAPMDIGPRKVYLTSKLKLWKKSPERFAVSAELNDYNERFVIDNDHLDRLRIPFDQWHHGITATVSHVRYQGDTKRHIVLHQSNGYHLDMSNLSHAINFARRQAMQLTARYGDRKRILVPAHAPISGERNF